MIVEELKKSVLQSALSGDFHLGNKDDSKVEEMLDKIKDIQILNKKYKSSNSNSKFPFKIPDNWRWVELNKIVFNMYAGGDKPKDCVSISDDKHTVPVLANGVTNEGIVGYTSTCTEEGMSLTIAGRGTIGFSMVRDYKYVPIVRLIVIKLTREISYDYLKYCFKLLIENGVGTSIKQLTIPMIQNKLIPLPPIEEQKRIVDKIEKLFKKLDEIKPIEEELNILKKSFSNNMKSSLFQSAISGKLTIQNNTENVNSVIDKLKSQKDISINKIPFEIPDNWTWIRFGDLVDFNIGKTPPRSDLSYWGKKGYNWVSISDMVDGELIKNTKEYVSEKAYNDLYHGNISKKGTLIMSFKLTVGRCSILDIDSFHNEGIISIYPKYDSNIIKQYLFKILPYITKYGDVKGAIKGNTLNSKSLNDLPIPLPPIEEQERIIKKLEQLLPLCDDIDNLVK